ncbi:DUF397 domain-containing protein [Pilimelia columellifera]|uniref:DUF397 domain-containing protein n=1 Tax=Pilimelia columellifera subsp. columellifera TaxID=706583 RepID=A0ABN3N575_9ACTN
MSGQKRRHYVKSSRSGGSGNCVEWAVEGHSVFVRDSKDRSGVELKLTHDEWEAIVAAVANGHDHPNLTVCPDGATVVHSERTLRFTPAEWEAFTDAAVSGECAVNIRVVG